MILKKFYKNFKKAFPNSAIYVIAKGSVRWLANPSTALTLYGKMEVVDIVNDYDINTKEPIFYIKVKE